VDNIAAKRVDLLFVGGSTVAEGVNPAHVGKILWNGETLPNVATLGLSGGTTTDVYFGTRLACTTPPKLLLYGITASDINDSRHEPHGVHSLLTFRDLLDWQQTRPEAAEWVTRHYVRDRLTNCSALVQHRHAVKLWLAHLAPALCPELAIEAQQQLDRAHALSHGNGYIPTSWFAHRQYDQMKATGWEQPNFEYLARYRTGSHLQYLARLIDWAAEHGTRLVLVDMPTTADLEARHPAEFAQYRECIRRLAKERNITVLSAHRTAVGLVDAHFADLIHLNRAGSDRRSAWLGEQLHRLGDAHGAAVVRGQQP